MGMLKSAGAAAERNQHQTELIRTNNGATNCSDQRPNGSPRPNENETIIMTVACLQDNLEYCQRASALASSLSAAATIVNVENEKCISYDERSVYLSDRNSLKTEEFKAEVVESGNEKENNNHEECQEDKCVQTEITAIIDDELLLSMFPRKTSQDSGKLKLHVSLHHLL